jgi:hypothetical protein
MHSIIALWTHPRSRSTAFERVMMERGDLRVLHEPFSYLYYVHKGEATIPQEYVDPHHPSTYPEIKDHLLSMAESSPVFFKDMCAHCFAELHADDAFLRRLTNTFLIRDPRSAIASYYALNPQVTLAEIGYEQVWKIFEKVAHITQSTPVVVNADDLIEHPQGVVEAYCQTLGLAFVPEALQWQAEHKPEWDIWKNWHTDAAQSTTIEKRTKAYEITPENSAHLRSYYEYHLPFYEAMNRHRLTVQ